MNGFVVSGKAFCVVEDLKRFAENHKGMKVAEFLRKRKEEEIEITEARQFGCSLESFRKNLKKH